MDKSFWWQVKSRKQEAIYQNKMEVASKPTDLCHIKMTFVI